MSGGGDERGVIRDMQTSTVFCSLAKGGDKDPMFEFQVDDWIKELVNLPDVLAHLD